MTDELTPSWLTPDKAQSIHEGRMKADPEHDVCDCWCCCVDCGFDDFFDQITANGKREAK